MSKTVLLTGASRGFGRLMATTLLEHGHVPVATMRDVDGRNKTSADALRDEGILVVELDLTDEESVNSGVAQAIEQVEKVDALVNNAGIVMNGPQETLTIDDIKRALDVNLYGVQRINRALLPHFREQQSGLLIYISGVTGRFPRPFLGTHNISDFVLEALAETYHLEISAFGIDTVILEPEYFPSGDGDDSANHLGSDTERMAPYLGQLQRFGEEMKSLYETATRPDAPSPKAVAEKIVQLIELPQGQRPLRTTVGGTLNITPCLDRYNDAYDEHWAAFDTAYQALVRPKNG